MRHLNSINKLSKPVDQRKALLRSIVRGLIINESVKTTHPRAKASQRLAEQLVSYAKRGDLHSRRLALKIIPEAAVVHKLFAEIGPRYTDRPGGFTQVIRAGTRRGDSTQMAILRWTD